MEVLKVFGPPGTGKTTKMLQIMEQELGQGLDPARLAYLTFTVQARQEALSRAMGQFKLTRDELPHFRTLHAICYRELGMTAGGMVRGQEDLKALSELLGVEFTYKVKHGEDLMLEMPYGGEVGDRLLMLDHLARHRLQTPGELFSGYFDDDITERQFAFFQHEYTKWRRFEGLRDFTDLLEQAAEPLDVDVVIVDEAQDLSALQWDTLGRLSQRASRLYLAGDDDQAIFTWAGASSAAFLTHEGKAEVLSQSYRVPKAIQPVGQGLVDRIMVRQPKSWRPRESQGLLKRAAPDLPIDFPADGSILVLYRHHYLVQGVEEQVRLHGLPYLRGDRDAPGAEWGRAIIYWERLRQGKELSWKEARQVVEAIGAPVMTPEKKRKFHQLNRSSPVTSSGLIGLLQEPTLLLKPWYEALTRLRPDDVAYLRALVRYYGSAGLRNVPRIRLSTIHAAKGAEADHVILLTDVSRRIKDTLELNPDDERRVFYVGVTRAKETLTLVGDDNPLF